MAPVTDSNTLHVTRDEGSWRATLGEHSSLCADPFDAIVQTAEKAREAKPRYKFDRVDGSEEPPESAKRQPKGKAKATEEGPAPDPES